MSKEPSDLIRLFAVNLRRVREAAGISQEELADRANLDRTYVSGCERGVRNPTLRSVEKIARALSVPPSELLK